MLDDVTGMVIVGFRFVEFILITIVNVFNKDHLVKRRILIYLCF